MKRILVVLLACLLLCGLVACGTTTEQPTETVAPEITTQAVLEPTAPPEITTQVVEAMTDPDFDAEALFQRLEGVWDDDYEIPGFVSFIYKSGKPSLYSGVYNGETNGVGALIGGNESVNEGIVTLYFLYPAFDDVDSPVPERTSALQIDLTGIDDGELRIQTTSIWHTSKWRACTYRCKTLREAGVRAIW